MQSNEISQSNSIKKSTLRQRRFRQFLFHESELQPKAEQLETQLAPLYHVWQNGLASEPEIVARYIIEFLRVMRPHDFRGGLHYHRMAASPENLPSSVGEFAQKTFRSTPLSVNRALVLWAEGRSRLKLLDYVPDAMTILRLQAKGERIVTCFFKPHELTRLVEGKRDPLGFVMHDLVHADHFYGHSEWTMGQVDFYADTLRRLEGGEFDNLLKDDHLASRFTYVISDMNSHPEHLKQTLASILEGQKKRQQLNAGVELN